MRLVDGESERNRVACAGCGLRGDGDGAGLACRLRSGCCCPAAASNRTEAHCNCEESNQGKSIEKGFAALDGEEDDHREQSEERSV